MEKFSCIQEIAGALVQHLVRPHVPPLAMQIMLRHHSVEEVLAKSRGVLHGGIYEVDPID